MAKVDISKLTIGDLVNFEKATREVCKRYEYSIRNYDGSISTSGDDYEKYDKYNKIYQKIISEIENRISEL